MPCPIVFIHFEGTFADGKRNECLTYSLAQANMANPRSPIILISDGPKYYDFVFHVPLADMMREADAFANVYQHMNSNGELYELFCFKRWFILKEFMAKFHATNCVYLDSDIMLFADIESEARRFAEYDLTVSLGCSPHCNFVGSQEGLKRFCDYVVDMYTLPHLLNSLEQEYKNIRARISEGGVCDMTLFQMYGQKYPNRVCDLGIVRNGTVYDHNINGPFPDPSVPDGKGFVMMPNGGPKAILFKNRLPYCHSADHDMDVRFMTLHFQGYAKNYLPEVWKQVWGQLPHPALEPVAANG